MRRPVGRTAERGNKAGQQSGRVPAREAFAGAVEDGGVTRLEETYIRNRERIQPHMSNSYGTAHGGEVMRFMDEIGAMSAMRLAGENCVTASVQGIDFERPIPVGDVAAVESYAYATGRSSVRTYLQVERENPRTGEREISTTSTFVFVAIRDGEPTPVPDVAIETDRERRLEARALESERDG